MQHEDLGKIANETRQPVKAALLARNLVGRVSDMAV